MELREVFEQWLIIVAMVGGTVGAAIAVSILWEWRNGLVQRLQREPYAVQLAQARNFGADYDYAVNSIERITGYTLPTLLKAKIRAEIVALDEALEVGPLPNTILNQWVDEGITTTELQRRIDVQSDPAPFRPEAQNDPTASTPQFPKGG